MEILTTVFLVIHLILNLIILCRLNEDKWK